MPFRIIREDITRVEADAIVNTANPDPVYGAGTDTAIYLAAGEEQLLEERRKIGKISVGEIAVTEAFALPAKYIIHTVGPVWTGGDSGELELLSSCYRKSLLMAKQLACESIAFPLISSGSYRFPKDKALDIALSEIHAFLDENDMDVTLVVFDKRAYELSAELTGSVQAFIDEKYTAQQHACAYSLAPEHYNRPEISGMIAAMEEEEEESISASSAEESISASSDEPSLFGRTKEKLSLNKRRRLADLQKQVGESYQACLLRLIDERGLTDAQVYKRANIDRRVFSKIRSNPAYHPKKQTALALAMALELNLDDTIDLVGRAGIALSDANLFDLIIEYCIENRIYDLYTVNAILFDHDQLLLGG